ncbi:MAG TPA: hypothetical protein VF796_15320 [Humisphaera sp.]
MNRQFKLALSLLGITLIAAGCGPAAVPPTAGPNAAAPRAVDFSALPSDAAWSMAKTADIVHTATRVESYRIEPRSRREPAEDRDDVDGPPATKPATAPVAGPDLLGYPIVRRGPDLDGRTTRRLVGLMTDPRGYNGGVWRGAIRPGVAFRFVAADGRTLTVLVCFKCQEWGFYIGDERLGQDSFGGLQPELLQLVRAVFPGDADLRDVPAIETYARTYAIDELSAPAAAATSETQRMAVNERWYVRVQADTGDPDGWRDNGGQAYSLRATADGRGLIVFATADRHAAVARLKGLTVMPVPE